MTEKEKQNSEEKPFVVRSYTKIELALLYCPGREPATALQSLYRWMRKCAPLRTELQQYGYDKHRHSFLKREVEIIRKRPLTPATLPAVFSCYIFSEKMEEFPEKM